MSKNLYLLVAAATLAAVTVNAAPLPVKARMEKNAVVVDVAGKPFTEYRFVNSFGKKPYLWPLAGPVSGRSVTTESSEPYPHHNSMWFGCDHINGWDFWHHQNPKGRIVSRGPRIVEGDGARVVIEDVCDWQPPEGKPVMRDYRRITISAPDDKTRLVDFDVVWVALEKIKITKTNHSLFALRMAPELAVKAGGTMRDTAGDETEKGTFGKAAPWMDCFGSRDGVVEGAAILQHPSNRWYPSPWFTRDYGFMSPTPMFWLEQGYVELAANEAVPLSYRVIVHAGDDKAADIDRAFAAYADTTPAPVMSYIHDVLTRELPGVAAYEPGTSRAALMAVQGAVKMVSADAGARAETATLLLPLLTDAKATYAGRQFVCEQLSLIGGDESTVTLSALLTGQDDHLAFMGCFALSRILTPGAAAALREALPKLKGRRQAAVVTALAERRDAPAVAAIASLAGSADADVAEPAVSALGRIGGADAARALLALWQAGGATRPGLTEAMLSCGTTLGGDVKGAAALYRAVYEKAPGAGARLGALRGLLISEPEATDRILSEALASPDAALRAGAAALLPAVGGANVTRFVVERLGKAAGADRIALLGVLEARGDRSAAPAVRDALRGGDKAVNDAAYRALGGLGDASDVPLLAGKLGDPAAAAALVRLKGKGVTEALMAALTAAEGPSVVALLDVLGERGDAAAAPALLERVEADDAAVRRAALKALEASGGRPALDAVLTALQREGGDEARRKPLEACAAGLCGRLAGQGGASAFVLQALPGAAGAGKASLLRVLGRLQEDEALPVLRENARAEDPVVADAAVRALIDWPRESALGALLEVARETKSMTHHVLALRGYLRLLKASSRPLPELKEQYDAGKAVARRDEEKAALTLDISGAVVKDLKVKSKGAYRVHFAGMRTGVRWATDREYVFEKVPGELAGATYIEVAMDDRTAGDADFLSFAVEKPAEVYVGFDSRCKALPGWLKAWTRTDEKLVPPDTTGCVLILYKKRFEAGRVTLGGCKSNGTAAMYSVIVKEAK